MLIFNVIKIESPQLDLYYNYDVIDSLRKEPYLVVLFELLVS